MPELLKWLKLMCISSWILILSYAANLPWFQLSRKKDLKKCDNHKDEMCFSVSEMSMVVYFINLYVQQWTTDVPMCTLQLFYQQALK